MSTVGTGLELSETQQTNQPPHKRPIILVFLTDDHGPWAGHCFGNSELITPTFDFLAETGVWMRSATTPSPVCSPARASFWTGQIPSQHGIHDWINEITHGQKWLEETTIASLLQAGGYQTGFVGKWHCGQSWVQQAGFDYYLGENKDQYPHKGICKFSENGKPTEHNGQRSSFVTEKAMDFLKQHSSEQPFFLFVGYVDTHSPFRDHPERWVNRYKEATFKDIPNEKYTGPGEAKFKPPANPNNARQQLVQYYASVSYIDEQVGQILDLLEARGELDNTFVVYTSDHGHNNGHHGIYTKGNATNPQNLFDESIRLPTLIRWKGHIPAKQVRGEQVDHCDLFQTLLEVAQVEDKNASHRNSPGKSYLSLITGKNTNWRDAQFCEYGNARMLRTENFKFITRYKTKFGNELYDLKNDPRETTNVINNPKFAQTAQELQQRLETHFKRYEIAGKSGINLPDSVIYNSTNVWRQ